LPKIIVTKNITPEGAISAVTLKRTDTTHDLSQKAKRSWRKRKFKRKK